MRMRSARCVGVVAVSLGLLATTPGALSAAQAFPDVSMRSLPSPVPLPDDHRHRTIELTFGWPDDTVLPDVDGRDGETDETGETGELDEAGELDEVDEIVSEDGPPVIFPFAFTLEVGTADFMVTSVVSTEGLECTGERSRYACTVDGPGVFVISVSGPENGPTVGCTLWAAVLSGETLLASLGDYPYGFCLGFPPPPDDEDGIDAGAPDDQSLPQPVPLDTLPETGASTSLVMVAALVLGAGLLLTWAARPEPRRVTRPR